MFPEEHLNIDTPENVIFDYEIVGIGSRFMAALVDTTLIVILQLIVYLPMVFLFGDELGSGQSSWLVGLFILIAFMFLWGYYIFFEVLWNGQSPGKRLVGLRVLCNDGTPITLTESIIRNLVRIVDFLPIAYGIGVVTMFIDGKSRRLGDMAASTLVIRDKESVTLDSLNTQLKNPLHLNPESEVVILVKTWPLDKLTQSDIQLAENLLQRRSEISNGPDLANQILHKFFVKMDVDANSDIRIDKVLILGAIVYVYNEQE